MIPDNNGKITKSYPKTKNSVDSEMIVKSMKTVQKKTIAPIIRTRRFHHCLPTKEISENKKKELTVIRAAPMLCALEVELFEDRLGDGLRGGWGTTTVSPLVPGVAKTGTPPVTVANGRFSIIKCSWEQTIRRKSSFNESSNPGSTTTP